MTDHNQSDDLVRVMEGNFDKIPGKPKKEVRIFLSSTFTGKITKLSLPLQLLSQR